MNKARVKLVLLTLIVFLILIQIFQPERTNPPVEPSRTFAAHADVPRDVHSVLMRGCEDCHSNRTRWPWYSHIAPLSWVITDDVNQGRRHMDFDDWEAVQDPQKADERIPEICKEIKQNGMPPFSYRVAHRDLTLKTEEITSICSWAESLRTHSVGSQNASERAR
jgi:hypothetical protein